MDFDMVNDVIDESVQSVSAQNKSDAFCKVVLVSLFWLVVSEIYSRNFDVKIELRGSKVRKNGI